jgi:hydrogenase small subunit
MPNPEEKLQEGSVSEEILQRWELRGVSRRSFLKFCSAMTATLALPVTMMAKVAEALEGDPRWPTPNQLGAARA